MKEMTSKATNELLDGIAMPGELITNEEYRAYFTGKSGTEHYRLLKYLSYSFSDELILDIGTLYGCSALALSSNPRNEVYSFNIVDNDIKISSIPKNITFRRGNVLSDEYKSEISRSALILLDTMHTGVFERQIYRHLLKTDYHGVLLLDDIYLNKEMVSFWNDIKEDKQDITNLGHSTGTGIVYFDKKT